jgi:hypothetical protein
VEDWLRSALRLLTNCCADPEEDGSAEENRAKVIERLPISFVINTMNASTQRTEAVSLFYNIGSYDGRANLHSNARLIIAHSIIENFRTIAVSAGIISVLWKVLEDLSQPGSHDLRLLGPICEMLVWAPEGKRPRIYQSSLLTCKSRPRHSWPENFQNSLKCVAT